MPRTVSRRIAVLTVLFFVLGGTAWAVDGPLPGRNQVGSLDLINGEVHRIDIADGAVSAAKLAPDSVDSSTVAADSLTGADINESTLGTVPAAMLAGIGRSTGSGVCDPEGATFVTCVTVTLQTPFVAKVLLIGSVVGKPEGDASRAVGTCHLATQFAVVSGSSTTMAMRNSSDDLQFHQSATMTAVTGVQGAGTNTFRVECNQEPTIGAIQYEDVQLSAVALASN